MSRAKNKEPRRISGYNPFEAESKTETKIEHESEIELKDEIDNEIDSEFNGRIDNGINQETEIESVVESESDIGLKDGGVIDAGIKEIIDIDAYHKPKTKNRITTVYLEPEVQKVLRKLTKGKKGVQSKIVNDTLKKVFISNGWMKEEL